MTIAAGLLWPPIAAAQDAEATTEATTEELPKLADMVLPDYDELMTAIRTGPMFDWVVLKDGSVLVTDIIYPRPDPLGMLIREKADLEANSRKTQEDRERLVQLRQISIVLLEDQSTDYQLPFNQVDQIISFPMLILRRVDALLKDGEIRKAYELLMEIEQLAPGWDQSVPRFDALLLREAELKVQDGQINAALALLDELAARNIDNPQLPVLLTRLIEPQFRAAMEAEDYLKAKYYLERFSRHFPQHEVVTGWIGQMQNRMSELLQQGQQLAADGRHREAAEAARAAERVWKSTGNQRVLYQQLAYRYQTLRVPVRAFSRTDIISPIPLEADKRHQELTSASLFEATAADELTYFQSGYFDLWDPQDLGREVVFSIARHRPYWQTQPILSANQIADALGDQLNPKLETFNPRLASFVREFSVPSPNEVQVSFHRVPLNLEALFRFPVTGFPPGQVPSADARRQVLSTKFGLVDESQDRRVYQRTIPEPDGLIGRQYHIAEIQEIRYPDRESVIRAFNREEVDVLPHLLPWEVDVFRKFPEQYAVQQYAIPQTHVIVFNPLSPAVASPQLRRALSFGVDRENLLKIVLLRDEEMKYGRPVSAPWHSGSYANSPLVKTPKYDHYLSYLLRLAALEQLRIPDKQKFVAEAKARALANKEDWDEAVFRRDHADEINAAASHIQLPRLKMLCDPDEVVMLAAEQMLTRWKALGFDIELVPADQPGETSRDWDMMYRRVRIEEPLLDLWSVLLTDDTFDVSLLASYPDWMRQELINLDYATSFVDAQQKLFTIHRHMAAQSFLVPLWEIDDFMVFPRIRVKGFEGRPLSVYHGVERWTVVP
ncbi:MAG: ABC transporter substrate-binding protein [Fuerstiella sp.]